ncbi:DinB family protein [Imperialibacter roseus]|uniref:DinB family protein n=1 Tax=Imperialibacter roseus TaxID=1324217 RepID=A0ABZ0IZP6_9BACT|nr:DinB family protein [Imperialibacter roseus]WOK09614.1 DinB family protein [Imperialibacter roseus]
MLNKEQLKTDIHTTFATLSSLLDKFSDSQLNTVPFEGSWTAGQVAEHIIICGSGIPESKTEPAKRSPNDLVKPVSEMFLNFGIKFKTAPMLEPQQSHHSKKATLDTISEIEKTHLRTVANSDLEALCMDMELPTFGYMTRYEWVRFVLVHTQRHTRQIENIYKAVE